MTCTIAETHEVMLETFRMATSQFPTYLRKDLGRTIRGTLA
jgi:hypothetical protein